MWLMSRVEAGLYQIYVVDVGLWHSIPHKRCVSMLEYATFRAWGMILRIWIKKNLGYEGVCQTGIKSRSMSRLQCGSISLSHLGWGYRSMTHLGCGYWKMTYFGCECRSMSHYLQFGSRIIPHSECGSRSRSMTHWECATRSMQH